MAPVIQTPQEATKELRPQETPGQNIPETRIPLPSTRTEDEPTSRGLFDTPVLMISIVVIALVVIAGIFFFAARLGSKSTTAPAASTTVATPTSATSTAQPTPAEIEEMQARDAFAVKVSKELHARVPTFKNVKIYADNWAGPKAPAKTPLADPKARKGDNLMLVFWSPDEATAKGLADFTKSKSAQEATDLGFAEFQFVDPNTYCYSQVAPVTGPGPVTCGIR
jgi:hypothetical protein